MNDKVHICSIRLSTEEYGWLVRYCAKNDISISAGMRKALKMYRTALAQKKQQQQQQTTTKEQE